MQDHKHILCVEDDHETAELIAEELDERGYAVDIARDGREGLAAILNDEPELVLADIGIPYLSGFELLERVRAASPRCSAVPFVFVTAFTDCDIELRARQLGAEDFITKPIDFERLDAIISARLGRVERIAAWPKLIDMSEREVETLTWAARGKTSAEIAVILGMSRGTVDFHIDNARIKLGATTRVEAAIKAATGRLIHP